MKIGIFFLDTKYLAYGDLALHRVQQELGDRRRRISEEMVMRRLALGGHFIHQATSTAAGISPPPACLSARASNFFGEGNNEKKTSPHVLVHFL